MPSTGMNDAECNNMLYTEEKKIYLAAYRVCHKKAVSLYFPN